MWHLDGRRSDSGAVRCVVLLCLGLLTVLLTAVSVQAGKHSKATAKTYDVGHQFRLPIQYPSGAAQLPEVWVVTTGTTTAKNPGVTDTDNIPPLIPAGVPAAGRAFNGTCTSLAAASTATANTGGNVNPFGVGTPWITGNYRVWGVADAKAVFPGSAKAKSKVEIHARGVSRLPNGRVRFGPEKMTSISGGTKQRARDPLSLEVQDLVTQDVLYSGDLYDVVFDLTDGEYLWENDLLTIDVWEGQFQVSVPGSLTLEQGDLSIALSGGVVTSASATGIFSGLTLPAVGEANAFSVDLPNMVELTLDLPSLDADTAYQFDWGMFSEGEADDAIIPEPASLALWFAGMYALRSRQHRR